MNFIPIGSRIYTQIRKALFQPINKINFLFALFQIWYKIVKKLRLILLDNSKNCDIILYAYTGNLFGGGVDWRKTNSRHSPSLTLNFRNIP